jgi:hypothetical protein
VITEAEVRSWFEAAGVTIATDTEDEGTRLARIVNQINSGERTAAEVQASINSIASGDITFDPNADPIYGGGGGTSAPTTTNIEVTGPGSDGVYTEAEVRSWFELYGATIETIDPATGQVLETEAQRLTRITQQLNSGSRSELEIRQAIVGTTLEGATVDPNAALRYGGSGADLLAEITGGSGEVWLDSDSGIYYSVYFIPGTTVPIYYQIPDITAFFPDGNVRADRTVTSSLLAQMGAINGGQLTEVAFGNPYIQFISQLEDEAAIRPWLLDADGIALAFEAALEGRAVTFAEIASTTWWQTHNEAERAWLTLASADPMTAAQMLQSGQIDTRNLLEQLGMADPPADIVSWMSAQRVTGAWSDEYFQNQLRALSDPQSGIAVDATLAAMVGERSLDTIRQYEERVRQTVAQWLGPVYGNWSDSQVTHWAGRMRNDPDATENLTELLRGQRMALFPEYENDLLTYEDIAGPWRNMVENTWGQPVEETELFFQDLLRMKDYAEAAKVLRQEGLSRDITNVTQNLESVALSTGGQVRS